MKHLLLTTIAAVLLVGCGPSVPDISIHEAARTGNIEAVKQHLAAGADVNAKDDSFGGTPLHYAAMEGHMEIVELLITKGTNVNAKDSVGLTPLHRATTKKIAELLVAAGANVNAKGDGGWTPLHNAAVDGHKEIAELLIAQGADVNAKIADGYTPLDYARSKPEITNLLRKHGGKTGEELKAEGK